MYGITVIERKKRNVIISRASWLNESLCNVIKACKRLNKPSPHRLPLDLLVLANEFVDNTEVVLLEILNLWNIITLAVKVVWVERPNSLKHTVVLFVHHPPVCILLVPGVERVVSDHSQPFVRDGRLILHDVVEVLVVTPAQHNVIKSAARQVDAMLCTVDFVVEVGVVLECIRVDDTLVKGTAHRECVADHVPLTLCVVEEEKLAQVVDETDELHPARLAVPADGFGGLEEVIDLGEGCIRVGLVNECVELLHGLPDSHLGASLAMEVVAGAQIVGYGLLLVLLAVEVLDAVACFFILTELSLVLLCVEFRLLVDVLLLLCGGALLDLHGGLEDVDIVDHVRCGLEGKTITVVVEGLGHVGLLEDGAWCHSD
jgi:hypothetical protein